eukprot:m.326284 g.326284  ORF g.326284 m.326284 type:complete len:149 (-) comp16478_c0_seq9:53-499(-)
MLFAIVGLVCGDDGNSSNESYFLWPRVWGSMYDAATTAGDYLTNVTASGGGDNATDDGVCYSSVDDLWGSACNATDAITTAATDWAGSAMGFAKLFGIGLNDAIVLLCQVLYMYCVFRSFAIARSIGFGPWLPLLVNRGAGSRQLLCP